LLAPRWQLFGERTAEAFGGRVSLYHYALGFLEALRQGRSWGEMGQL
jgi:hypothetical protein